MQKVFVISLGGSLIVPHQIDESFLKDFRKRIIDQIEKGKKFVIITGGGYVAREYQKSASQVTDLTDEDRDWLGIHATRMNGHLIKTIFRDYTYPVINKNPQTEENLMEYLSQDKSIMVATGWRPGRSTDYVATKLAQRFGSKTVINLSNIKYVYDKDPKHFSNAKAIKNISWSDFRKIVGDRWDPGLNVPFDPVASKLAEELKLKVVIADGKNLANLTKILNNQLFEGTVIE